MDRVDVRICGQDQDKTNFLGGQKYRFKKAQKLKVAKRVTEVVVASVRNNRR